MGVHFEIDPPPHPQNLARCVCVGSGTASGTENHTRLKFAGTPAGPREKGTHNRADWPPKEIHMELDLFQTGGTSPPEVEEAEDAVPAYRRRIRADITDDQRRAINRLRHPEGITCSTCGVLLATRPESYAKSPTIRSEADRLAYVCAGCRWDAQEAEKTKAARRAASIVNLESARAARRLTQVSQNEAPSASEIPGTSSTVFRRGRAFKPGRPRVPKAEQQRKARDRDRAYRARRKAEPA